MAGRKNEAKGLGRFEVTGARVVLNTDLQVRVPGKMPLSHTKGP